MRPRSGAQVLPSLCVPGCPAQPVASPVVHPPPASAASETIHLVSPEKVGEWQTWDMGTSSPARQVTSLPHGYAYQLKRGPVESPRLWGLGRCLGEPCHLPWNHTGTWVGGAGESLAPMWHLLPSDPQTPGRCGRCGSPYQWGVPHFPQILVHTHLLRDTLASYWPAHSLGAFTAASPPPSQQEVTWDPVTQNLQLDLTQHSTR